MTSGLRSRVRTAAATAVVMSTAGLAAIGSPADGVVTAPLTYSCTLDGGITGNPHEFTVVVDTDAPASLVTGQSVDFNTTAAIDVAPAVTGQIRAADAVEVDGTATFTLSIDGDDRSVALTIPRTAVPPTSETQLQLVATGPSGTLLTGPAGTSRLITVESFSGNIAGWDSGGLSLGGWPFSCALSGSQQNTLVDTVSVVPKPTTTTLALQPTSVEFGAAPVATADVSVNGSSANVAGKVTFTFEGKSVTVDLKGGRAKATLSPASVMGARPVTAVFAPTDPNLAVSQAAASVVVVKDQTTTSSTLVYRAAKHRLVGKAHVDSQHGSAVAGVVRFVLKRNGVRLRTALVELNRYDTAKKVFKNINRRGRYVLVSRYLGSPTLKRSVDRVGVVI